MRLRKKWPRKTGCYSWPEGWVDQISWHEKGSSAGGGGGDGSLTEEQKKQKKAARKAVPGGVQKKEGLSLTETKR